MILPEVREQILRDLDRLSPAEQERAAALVRGLLSPPEGASTEDLLPLAGTLDGASACEMIEAIEYGCERAGNEEG